MAGTENCKSLCQITKKGKRRKTKVVASTSSEDSTFTGKKFQAEGHSSVTTRTERKQTRGGSLYDGNNGNLKSTLCRHEYDPATGTSSKEGRSLRPRKGEASCEARQMSQASSSRNSHIKGRDKFKGSSGYGQKGKGKCLKSESHSGHVEGQNIKNQTDHDRKWYKNRRGGKKNKQKYIAITGTTESELSCRNKRSEARKKSAHQSKSHMRGKFSKSPEERNEVREGTEHKDNSVTSPNQPGSSSAGVREIPGFHYDQEKKRYFRILPGQFHSNSWITPKTIQEKKEDDTRRKFLKQENQPKHSTRQKSTSTSAVSILQSLQRGELSSVKYFRSSIECRIRAMNLYPLEEYYDSWRDLLYSGFQFHTKFLQVDKSQSKLLLVLESERISKVLFGSVSTDQKGSSKELQLNDWHDLHFRNDCQIQISSVSFVNISQEDSSPAGNLYALFSWSCDVGNGVQLVRCPSDDFAASRTAYRFESPGEIIRSCSWCSNPRYPAYVCIGFSNKAEVIDTLSTSRQILNTKSEVYSQVFAREQPLIYLGTKRGHIMTYDLRIHPSSFLMSFEESSNSLSSLCHGNVVCSLKLLKDESYLLAGSFNGLIRLWDLRKRAVVKEIHGHANTYKPLPVEMDESESLVYAVGQDKLTRIWNLKDCSHLKTIPYPYTYTLSDSTLVAAMSLDWGGKGLPGLMTSAFGKLYWYPF